MKPTLRRILSLASALLLLCSALVFPSAANSVIQPAEQVRSVFNADNGFPSETVWDIAMTEDGLLWFATADGLIRYDGYDFTLINQLTEPTFDAMRVSVLCPADAGTLWVGTNGSGLLHLADGKWSSITTETGALSDSICDINLLPDGSVAVAVPTGVYFANPDGTVRETYALSDRALVVQDIAVGPAGNVFGVTGDGALFSILEGGFSFSTLTREGEYTYTAVDSADGRFLLGTSDGNIIVIEKNAEEAYDTTRIETGLDEIRRISHDADNNFHIISQDGWGILFADGSYVCMQADGVEGLTAFCIDFQGNYWLGTRQNGAVKISAGSCYNWNSAFGLDAFSASAVLQYNGYICVGTSNGLLMLHEATGETAQNALTDATAGKSVRCLLADRDGGLWAAVEADLYRLDSSGRLQSFTAENGMSEYTINVLLQTENGDIAVGTDNGLCFIRENRVVYTYTAANGVLGQVSCLLQNGSGSLLVGTVGNGVFRVDADGSVKAYSAEEGFPAGEVACMVHDPEVPDRIWFSIGSELLYHDGEQTAVGISGLLLTGEITDLFFIGDSLWLVTSNGVAAVKRADMFTAAETLPYKSIGKRQGISAAISVESQNFADENGMLYVCTGKGVNRIDTRNYQSAIPIPRILFCTAASGENTFALHDGVVISGTSSDVQLSFTAITYSAASDFYLEYKLEGVDAEYTRISPAAENRISYNRLARGTYTLYVRAVNESGTPLGAPASVTFTKEASYGEHAIFWIAVAAIGLLLIGGGAFLVITVHAAILKRRQKRYRDITRQSISAIVNAVDAKDTYTRGHSDRVAKYAAEIARRYGLKPLKVSDIYYSALLHDIGKIGIPDEILKKPGKLTDAEYEIIKKHAEIGADIVKDITAIPHISRGIHDHHERYDGNGYPRGLRGNSISLEGRIIGMADAYDAMSSTRGYSAPHTKDYIASEIREGQGKQFDPKIAEIALQMLQEGFFDTFTAQGEETASDTPPETPPTA